MAHINGMIHMMNSLHANINTCSSGLIDLNKRIKEIEANRIEGPVSPAPVPEPVEIPTIADIVREVVPLLKADNDALRAKVLALEAALARERTLIESTVLAKAEEFVRRIVRERVTAESDAITERLKAHVDEQLLQEKEREPDIDAISIAFSDVQSKSGGAKRRAGPKKNQTIIDVE